MRTSATGAHDPKDPAHDGPQEVGPIGEHPGRRCAAPVPGAARVLVCEDHEVLRAGLCAVLGGAADLRVVGEATSAAEAAEVAPRVGAQLALVDLDLVGARGLVGTLDRAGVRVVVLAEPRAERDAAEALHAGASGCVARDATSQRLLQAVRAVARGEAPLVAVADRPGAPPPGAPRLTPRQRAVADLVGQGLSNSAIAARLYLSETTVKSHLSVILRRLELRDRTQLAIAVNRRSA